MTDWTGSEVLAGRPELVHSRTHQRIVAIIGLDEPQQHIGVDQIRRHSVAVPI